MKFEIMEFYKPNLTISKQNIDYKTSQMFADNLYCMGYLQQYGSTSHTDWNGSPPLKTIPFSHFQIKILLGSWFQISNIYWFILDPSLTTNLQNKQICPRYRTRIGIIYGQASYFGQDYLQLHAFLLNALSADVLW